MCVALGGTTSWKEGGSGEGLGPLNVDRLVTLEGGRDEARMQYEAVIHG